MMVTTSEADTSGERKTLRTIRLFLLALVLLGILGFTVELFLLEHTESLTQIIPFVVLGLGFVSGIGAGLRPARGTIRTFQAVMVLFVAAGVLGLYLHYSGNLAFEREMDAGAAGIGLIWQSLRGATPALAPAGMIQLGLLGLIHAFRHPALSAGADRV